MICKRGVLYVTPVCNLKCKFCYYRSLDNSERKHTPIQYLKAEADRQRFEYDLTHTDLTGFGEPTTHPNIIELVNYCNDIGLRPTVITNGQMTNVIKDLVENCVDDLLLSVHCIGEDYDKLTDVNGSWARMKKTLTYLKSRNFKFRANITVTNFNKDKLKETVQTIIDYGGRMVDFILFNPHEATEWAKKTAAFQATYTEATNKIKECIDFFSGKILMNVRYVPLCFMKGYEKYVINFHQWIFDEYGWEESHGNRLPKFKSEEEHLNFVKSKCKVNKKIAVCEKCRNKNICDGIYPQYLNTFGESEFKETEGELITHPNFWREL